MLLAKTHSLTKKFCSPNVFKFFFLSFTFKTYGDLAIFGSLFPTINLWSNENIQRSRSYLIFYFVLVRDTSKRVHPLDNFENIIFFFERWIVVAGMLAWSTAHASMWRQSFLVMNLYLVSGASKLFLFLLFCFVF